MAQFKSITDAEVTAIYEDYLAGFKARLFSDRKMYNGFFEPYKEAYYNSWERWVLRFRPRMWAIREHLNKEEKNTYGQIWHAGFISAGPAEWTKRSMKNYYADQAAADAEAERKAVGWTGNDHLTHPVTKKDTGVNGARYGRWAGGWDR